MRNFVIPGRTIARIALCVCLILVAAAVARVGWPPEAAPASATKRLVPVYRVDRTDKRIAISFDAAWGAEKTSEIMDVLDAYGIKTTFFLVGFWVDKYPDKVQEIARRGHEIGNHSTNHPHMTQLSAGQIAQELSDTAGAIERLTGSRPTLFRPPFGDYDNAVMQTATEEGYHVIQWDVDSLDWRSLGVDPMVRQVVQNVQPGSIVLFHNNSDYILDALPTILDTLTQSGYEIVPVSELLLPGETVVDATGCQRRK